jgi:hypothetical protein
VQDKKISIAKKPVSNNFFIMLIFYFLRFNI